MCARFSDAGAVKAMMVRGAKPESTDSRGEPPLMWAASGGRLEAVALLVKAGALVNRATPGDFTSLFLALASGKGDVVAALIAALLARGADPDARTGPSRITRVTKANFGLPPPPVQPTTPLLLAARAGQADAMRQLTAAGADQHFVDGAGFNVLLAAADTRSAAALGLALDLASETNIADARKTTALHMLVGGSFHPELEAMLRLRASHGARTALPMARAKPRRRWSRTGLRRSRPRSMWFVRPSRLRS